MVRVTGKALMLFDLQCPDNWASPRPGGPHSLPNCCPRDQSLGLMQLDQVTNQLTEHPWDGTRPHPPGHRRPPAPGADEAPCTKCPSYLHFAVAPQVIPQSWGTRRLTQVPRGYWPCREGKQWRAYHVWAEAQRDKLLAHRGPTGQWGHRAGAQAHSHTLPSCSLPPRGLTFEQLQLGPTLLVQVAGLSHAPRHG